MTSWRAREGMVVRSMAQHEIAREFEKMGFCYVGFQVDQKTFDAHNIGSVFKGGTVIEGTVDNDTNRLVLFVRYGIPEGLNKAPPKRSWWDRKDCGR